MKFVDEVYAVSFPKSGRTWIELMMAKIYELLTDYDVNALLNGRQFSRWNILRRVRYPFPFVRFGHGYMNAEICRGTYFPEAKYKGKKIFLLVRDPRDVVVSYYFYAKHHQGLFEGSLKEFIEYSPDSDNEHQYQYRFGINAPINYMNAWVKHSSLFAAFQVGYYVDFRQNTYSQLSRLCDFIGLPATPHMLTTAITYGSFENMRKLEMSNALNWHGLSGAKDLKGLKTRRGVVGGYQSDLDDGLIKYLDTIINARLHPFFEKYKAMDL